MILAHCRRLIARAVVAAALAILATACAVRQRPHQDVSRRIDSALTSGDTTTAVRLLRAIVGNTGCPPEEYVRLAQILRSRGSILDRFSAQRVLEEGLRRRPDHTDILVELGQTYYDRTFYGDAQRTFERVLSIDPDRCEAHYYLGVNAYRKWKRVQLYTTDLATAIEHLRRSADCAAENADGLFKLAFSEYMLGETTLAAEACASYRRLHPEAPEPLFLLGSIAYEEVRYGACWEYFRAAMALLTDDDRVNYTDIGLFLPSDDEMQRYSAASREEKANLQRLYWLEHDPDPTTEINERWLEHVYRAFLSEARFASKTPARRGWETERGQALIKFGAPDQIRTTLEGHRPLEGRIESWSYLGSAQGFVLNFQDEYLNGNYTVPIDDEFCARVLSDARPLTALVSESTPVSGALDVVAFRDSDTSSSVYVTYAANDDGLERHLRTWNIKTFVARTAFFDKEGRPRAYYADTLDADSLPRDTAHNRRSNQWAKRFALPIDSYRVSFCFEDERSLTQSAASVETSTLRFLGGSLALSDVLLHTTLTPAANPMIHRGHRSFFVNPRRAYAPSETLHLYVELYNLSLSDRRSDYEVTYSIHEADTTSSRKQRIGRAIKRLFRIGESSHAIISQSFERAGTSNTASEELAIDIRALQPGEYVLAVAAVDRISGERAGVSRAFAKLRNVVNDRGP